LRRPLAVAGIAILAALVAALWHGVHIPPPRLDPAPPPAEATAAAGFSVRAEGAYFLREEEGGRLVFRAHAPEPRLHLRADRDVTAVVLVENVHAEASVEPPAVAVRTAAATRQLSIPLREGSGEEVSFTFPPRALYRFAAIGDSGGEVAFGVLTARALELGADFLLHLGDICYSSDAFVHVAARMRALPIPVYAAIGNHDRPGGKTDCGGTFVETFGPRNSAFTLGGVTFVNMDTASDTWLPSRGWRGALLRQVAAQREGGGGPLVLFTHRPLRDPRFEAGEVDEPHALNRAWEASWIRATALALGAQALLAGHVHESHEFDDEGLRSFIAGEGYAFDEAEAPSDSVPHLLLGEYAPGEAVRFRWVPEMPPRDPSAASGSALPPR
jgi:hypothetical protein